MQRSFPAWALKSMFCMAATMVVAAQPLKIAHDWSLSDLAEILNKDPRILGDKIVSVGSRSRDHLFVGVGLNYRDNPIDEVDLAYDRKIGWKIQSVLSQPGDATLPKHHQKITVDPDWSLSEWVKILNRDKEIYVDQWIGAYACSPSQWQLRLATGHDRNDDVQTRVLNHDAKSGWQILFSGDLELRVVKVERVEPAKGDEFRGAAAVAAWEITTELTNRSLKPRFVTAVPGYGATVNGRIRHDSFDASSHVGIISKEHDFVKIASSGKLLARQKVFAVQTDLPGQYILGGYFMENLDVPKDLRCNNFAYVWNLPRTPVRNEFEVSMTMLAMEPLHTADCLGDDYNNYWRGEARSAPIKLQVFNCEAGGPVKIAHDSSLTKIARILNRDPRMFGDKIVGVGFTSPDHMRVTVGSAYGVFTGGDQTVQMVYEEKPGWRIESVGNVNPLSDEAIIAFATKHDHVPIKVPRDWSLAEIVAFLNKGTAVWKGFVGVDIFPDHLRGIGWW